MNTENNLTLKQNVIITFLFIFLPPIALIYIWIKKIGSVYFRSLITILPFLFFRKLLVLYMILYGILIFPEASEVLRHYCFGDGSKLISNSNYIKTSPVILTQVKNMKIGEKRKVGVHQWEDLRLTYALNPFTISKTENKVIISQWMDFDKSGKVLTFVGPFPIPDNIAHAFECKPYLFYHEFNLSDLDYNKVDPPNFIENYFIEREKKKGWIMGKNYSVVK